MFMASSFGWSVVFKLAPYKYISDVQTTRQMTWADTTDDVARTRNTHSPHDCPWNILSLDARVAIVTTASGLINFYLKKNQSTLRYKQYL